MGRFRVGVFDVDGTLVGVESWIYFHEALGTWGEARKYAELYRRGRITYYEWAQLDASLWRGTPVSLLEELVEEVPLTPGAVEAVRALRAAGVEIVLLSCGLDVMVRRVARELGVGLYVANRLVVDAEGRLTGQAVVNVSLDGKLPVLKCLLARLGAGPEACFAVGDDESMIPVFRAVSLGIAFNPKGPEVAKAAHVVIEGPDLRAILPYVLRQRDERDFKGPS